MNLPNFLSLVRIALVPLFFFLIILPIEYSLARWWALFVYALASLTDALDGYLARRWKQVTIFGETVDPLADKLLVLSGMIALHLTPQPVFVPPLWVTGLIILREMVFAGGLITFVVLKKKMPSSPNFLGKSTTLFQMVFVLSCLMNLYFSIYISFTTAALTIASGFVYTLRGARYLAKGDNI
ncbi:MAG TPA: CDP-diacylglycerol--glycerol-3-phosphate 3-phosphatidyltransferase [Candidatus Omnitrophica bacterium]|nr:CDP-diacylglycerol--glycerol-3-phosphate 3-phosphatidyltransferase [Candidatus Omnitrophota bacterium]